MWVYIVIRESVFRDEIVKVFTSSPKAKAFAEEQNKIAPYWTHRTEAYWAE